MLNQRLQPITLTEKRVAGCDHWPSRNLSGVVADQWHEFLKRTTEREMISFSAPRAAITSSGPMPSVKETASAGYAEADGSSDRRLTFGNRLAIAPTVAA
jgi:hypothetical protein